MHVSVYNKCMLVYVHTYLCMCACMYEKYMYSKYVCIYVEGNGSNRDDMLERR